MEKLGLKIAVECRTQACTEFGVRRRVPLFVVVEGVVAHPKLICASCRGELMDVTEQGEASTEGAEQ